MDSPKPKETIRSRAFAYLSTQTEPQPSGKIAEAIGSTAAQVTTALIDLRQRGKVILSYKIASKGYWTVSGKVIESRNPAQTSSLPDEILVLLSQGWCSPQDLMEGTQGSRSGILHALAKLVMEGKAKIRTMPRGRLQWKAVQITQARITQIQGGTIIETGKGRVVTFNQHRKMSLDTIGEKKAPQSAIGNSLNATLKGY